MEDMYGKAAQILDGLRHIELIVAELYKRFSRSFVQDRVFWEDLSRDEENHAVMVMELKNMLLKNGSPFELGNTSRRSVRLQPLRGSLEDGAASWYREWAQSMASGPAATQAQSGRVWPSSVRQSCQADRSTPDSLSAPPA